MAVSVNIKMYRVGELGDCFLLRFKSGQEQSHVLIDCGSFRNGGKSVERMKAIAADIQLQLNGAKMDVIAGTHQHNDHLSGFIHAQATFENMKPEQVWLSWLDNPNDQEATQIGKEYNNYLTRLRSIAKQLKTPEFRSNAMVKQMESLLGFYGITGNEKLNAKTDKFPPDLPAAARTVLQKIGKKKAKYLEPGQAFNLPGIAEGVKVYVLGPPKDEKLLYDKDPNKKETYDPKLSVNSFSAAKILSAMEKLSGSKKNEKDEEPFPFDEPYRKSKNYDTAWASYYNRDNKWRQIDKDWLNQAEQLALWLDGFTNNSSLVLAFELVKSGKVLLFAADAQTGNWNSWKTIKWKNAPAGFSWMHLMQNTVLYKTGHHGSHNSTLVEALEKMTHEELVVMIPVDKSDPNITKKNGWEMPAPNLFKELKKKCQDRVMLMDDGILKSAAWKKLPFKPIVTELYLEYEVRE